MTCGAAPGSPPSRASRTRKLDRSVRPQAPGSGVVRARGLLEPLRLFAVAVGFLTRVPVPQTDIRVDDLRRASAFFPLVGLGVAGVGVAVRAAFEPIWGSGVATLAAIAAMILVTGAFHEDGLADTADGLWGGWDPAARLAIMRDSRIGTYGAVALIIVIALRAGTPATAGVDGEALLGGRRRLGVSVVGPLGAQGIGVAAAVVAATLGLAARAWAPIPLAAGLVVCLGCARLFRRRLGGITGDAFGAANQVVELAAVAAIVALARAGLL